ncbi:MAG TPA: STAS domain-containing protein [Solirubrobacteraceae bacterium]
MHTPFDITLRWSDGQRAMVVSGELTLETAAVVQALLDIVCVNDATEVEFDLRDLTFIDSTGIGVIMAAKKACAGSGCGFFLIPSKAPQPARIWELSGLQDQISWREGPAPSSSSSREG